MKLNKESKKIAKDLGLSDIDAFIIDLKAKLYTKCAELIKCSKYSHAEIAKMIGTSRSRINRIANKGENNLSIEILLKIIAALEGKSAIKIAA